MAVQVTRKYTNTAEIYYDLAKNSPLFREEDYNAWGETGEHIDYLEVIANTKDKTSDSFNIKDYDLLDKENRLGYLMNEYYGDKNSEEYKKNKEQLDQIIQHKKDEILYASLSDFEKVINSIGGVLGNAANELFLGTVEGLIDLGGTIVGAKEFVSQDTTGVSANRQDLQDFARKYTYLDKNGFWKVANDVVTGITQMAPLALNIVAPGVGTGIYFSSMAGRTAEEAIKSNPEINYLSLIGYTAAVTGVEFATERLSKFLFGGSAIDNLMGWSTTSKAGSWISRVGIDFLSEGLEESIAEFADSVLYTTMIDPDAPLASIEQILYAGLIGGIIGGVGTTGRVMSTKNLTILEDGSVVTTKAAKELNLKGKDLTKAQSLTFNERLQNAIQTLKSDPIVDLQIKYSGEDLKSIRQNHREEFNEALALKEKNNKQLTNATVALSKVLEWAGVDGFNKAVDIANYTIQEQESLLKAYTTKLTGTTAKNRQVEQLFKQKNPGSSLVIADEISSKQQAVKDAIKNKFGIDVFFGTIGEQDGLIKKHGVTLDSKTIVLDAKETTTMSVNDIMNKVAAEELVHTLQYQSGILTADTLYELQQALGLDADEIKANVAKLDSSYNKKDLLTKLSEAQAKTIAQMILFDDAAIQKIFDRKQNIFKRIYTWLKGMTLKLTKNKTELNTLKYNTILKTMKKYRTTVANSIESEEELKNYMAVSDDELKEMLDIYLAKEKTTQKELEAIRKTVIEMSFNETNALVYYLAENKAKSGDFNIETYKNLIEGNYSVEDLRRMLGEFTKDKTGNITGTVIGNMKASNLVKDFLLKGKENQNIKSLEDANEFLNYALQYMRDTKILNKNVENNLEKSNAIWFITYNDLDNSVTSVLELKNYLETLNEPETEQNVLEQQPKTKNKRPKKEKTVTGEQISIDTLDDQKEKVVENETQPEKSVETENKTEKSRPKNKTKIIISDGQYKGLKDITTKYSENQLISGEVREYTAISSEIIENNHQYFGKINNDTWKEMRNEIEKSDDKYKDQMLVLFDYYCMTEGNFNVENQKDFDNLMSAKTTVAAQTLAMQSKAVKDSNVASAMANDWREHGFKFEISDEFTSKYIDSSENRINEITNKINSLKKELTKHFTIVLSTQSKNISITAKERGQYTELSVAALHEEIRKLNEEKRLLMTGTNEQKLDYAIEHSSVAEGGKIIGDLVNEIKHSAEYSDEGSSKTEQSIDAFPKFKEWCKKWFPQIKSFRIKMMLSSPVTWVRNSISNNMMRGLDKMLTGFERTIFGERDYLLGQTALRSSKGSKELSNHIKKNCGDVILRNVIRKETSRYDTNERRQAWIVEQDEIRAQQSKNWFVRNLAKLNILEQKALNRGFNTKDGLPACFFGDETIMLNTICDMTGNIIASNVDYICDTVFEQALNNERVVEDRAGLIKAQQSKDPTQIFDIMNNTTNPVIKAEFQRFLDLAGTEASKMYFRNDNAFNKLVNKIGEMSPAGGFLASIIMPFPKVAANVLGMAYRLSPLNFINYFTSKQKIKRLVNDPELLKSATGTEQAKMYRQFSEATFGTFSMIVGCVLAALGFIDVEEDDYMGPSLNLGFARIGLSDLAPALTTLSMGAAIIDAGKKDKDGLQQALDVLYNNTLLGNLDNIFMNASAEDWIGSVSINYVSQYIPAALKLFTKFIDMRAKDKSGNYFQRLGKTLASYIPGLSYAVPSKINPYTGDNYYTSGSDAWFKNILLGVLPIEMEFVNESDLEKEAENLGAESTGLSGSFTINDEDIKLSTRDKEKYAKIKAKWVNEQFKKIKSGEVMVTVQNEEGNYITTTYDKLTNTQKSNVLKQLYSKSTDIAKIKYWTDLGNKYVFTDYDKYMEYVEVFNTNGIEYKTSYSTTKFVKKG